MPSTDTFDSQEPEYKEQVLPSSVRKRLAVEAGATDYWSKYVGLEGKVIGMDRSNHQIQVSSKVLEAQAKEAMRPSKVEPSSKTTLGDLLREQIKDEKEDD